MRWCSFDFLINTWHAAVVVIRRFWRELSRRLLNILIAIDQALYVIATLGAGCPDETMSAAAWRTEASGKLGGRIFRPIIDFVFRPFERDHCRRAYESELMRHQLPDEYRARN